MLVAKMNALEVDQEIKNDYDTIKKATTLPRLVLTYMDSRKKAKISRTEVYPVFYPIRTKTKNTWWIKIGKKTEMKYLSIPEDCGVELMTYYFNNIGLRFFQVSPSGVIKVFNGHFFNRYQERTGNKQTAILEVAKDFFIKNPNGMQRMFRDEEDGRLYFTEIFPEGLALGQIDVHEEKAIWFVCNTFIANNTLTSNQKVAMEELRFIAAKKIKETGPGVELEPDLVWIGQLVGLLQDNKLVGDLDTIIQEGNEKYPHLSWEEMIKII